MFLAELEFKELICNRVESLMDGRWLLLSDETGHLIGGRKWQVQEVTGVIYR
jgi:hypothetical protein